MLRLGKTKVAKERFFASEKSLKIWDVNVDKTVISKLVKAKTNSKYLIGYLDKAIAPLVAIMRKISGYIRTFKVKDGDKVGNNKLMSFSIDDVKQLGKCKAIWTKIEDFLKKLNQLLYQSIMTNI